MSNKIDRENMKTLVRSINDLSAAYKRTGEVVAGSSREIELAKDLWARGRVGSMSPLVKLGLALIAFPDPTISDVIGFCFVGVGLAYSRVKPPPIYVENVYGAIEKELSEIGKSAKLP